MRFLAGVVGDSHFNRRSRWDECLRLHQWISDDMTARGIDVAAHAGDVFHAESTPPERLAVRDWLVGLATRRPVILVAGNHDEHGDLALFASLRAEHPIVVEERTGMHTVGRLGVAACAWPRKAALAAQAELLSGKRTDLRDEAIVARDHLRAVFTALGAQLAQHDGPRMLLAHAMVRKSLTSAGQPLVGCDMEIDLADLALCHGADITVLGHIHRGQDWPGVVYTGSPRRTAHGETEDKGYVVVEWEREDLDGTIVDYNRSAPRGGWRLVGWERVIAPARKMVLHERIFAPDDAGPGWLGDASCASCEGLEGAEVRFRYTVDSEHRAAGKRAAGEVEAEMLGAGGAFSVQTEQVLRPTTRARAPEVASATSMADKMRAVWKARGVELDPERSARLLDRVTALESDAARSMHPVAS